MRTALVALVYAVQRLTWRLLSFAVNRGGRFLDLVASTGIVVFVGPNGAGKSLIAVQTLLDTLHGEAWSCVAFDHAHNAPFAEHAADCDVCEPRTIDRPARCRVGGFFDLIAAHRTTSKHVSRCSRCEDYPGQFGGRCLDGVALLDLHGRGERLVYSTTPLLADDGTEHPRYRPCTDYRQLIKIEHADVLFDEVAGIADAADSATLPAALTRWLQQLRKRDVRLRITSPDYDRCAKPIRQVAQLVVDSRCFFEEPGTTGRKWRPRRAMLYRAYDGFAFQHFTAHTGESLKTQGRFALWRPGCEAQTRYDTRAQVLALADVTETGMCMACGGSRSRPRCSCPGHVDQAYIDGVELEVVESVSAGGARVRRAEPVAS